MKKSHTGFYISWCYYDILFTDEAPLSAAAGLLISSKRRDRITLFLASQHWLPVSFMIDFKIWLITFSACQGLAPSYVLELLTIYEPLFSRRASGGALLMPALLHQLKQCSPSNHLSRNNSAVNTISHSFSILSQNPQKLQIDWIFLHTIGDFWTETMLVNVILNNWLLHQVNVCSL